MSLKEIKSQFRHPLIKYLIDYYELICQITTEFTSLKQRHTGETDPESLNIGTMAAYCTNQKFKIRTQLQNFKMYNFKTI